MKNSPLVLINFVDIYYIQTMDTLLEKLKKPSTKQIKKPVKGKIKKPSKLDALLQKLKIDNTLTKPIYYKFPTVKEHIFPKSGYNYQCDTLMLPITKAGFRYLLVMVDLWSNYIDIEPVKDKQAETMLQAMKTIFKRDYLKKPEATLKTDQGTEFKQKFDQYLFDNSILHLTSLPDRHKQMANVESLNKILGQLFMTYLTNKSHELGHDYNDWTDIVDTVRTELNNIKNHPKDLNPRTHIPPEISTNEPKYNLGDFVYRRLEKPLNKFGDKYHNSKFRAGDNRFDINQPRKIVNIVAYKNSWRYIINDFPNVSYDEAELMPAKETEEKYTILKIIGKKIINKKIHYLVYWKGYKKSEATYEPQDNLLEDGAAEFIQEYEDEQKNK
jgi:hypothetical protein